MRHDDPYHHRARPNTHWPPPSHAHWPPPSHVHWRDRESGAHTIPYRQSGLVNGRTGVKFLSRNSFVRNMEFKLGEDSLSGPSGHGHRWLWSSIHAAGREYVLRNSHPSDLRQGSTRQTCLRRSGPPLLVLTFPRHDPHPTRRSGLVGNTQTVLVAVGWEVGVPTTERPMSVARSI